MRTRAENPVRPVAPDPPELAGADPAPAFGALFDRYAPGLHRYCASRVGSAVADDLVSETFLRAFRHRRSFDPGRGTVQSWLFGIATNLLGTHRRTEARHLAAVARSAGQAVPIVGPGTDAVEHRVDAAEQIRQLVPALLDLPAADRDILLLNAWVGLEPNEIAQALDLPAGTVRSRLHRIRRRLQAAAAAQAAAVRAANRPANP